MLAVLLSVVVISFSGVMMPGPMFAMTVAKSYHSPATGLRVSAGHAVVEVPLIALIYLGFARFFEDTGVQVGLSLVGGAMIIWMGVGMLRARGQVALGGGKGHSSAFIAGIATSGLNPYFLLWWATVGSLLIMQFGDFGVWGLVLFTVVHWLCDLAWLSLVSVVVYRTRRFWNDRVQQGVFVVCGVLLAGFGVWYLASGLRLLNR